MPRRKKTQKEVQPTCVHCTAPLVYRDYIYGAATSGRCKTCRAVATAATLHGGYRVMYPMANRAQKRDAAQATTRADRHRAKWQSGTPAPPPRIFPPLFRRAA